ncbi:3-hydroxyisobutyryl-CoA hydrolase, mitochondrial [Anthonomus grandis grandis]|uniref:3-hydroxyisobutyryl-CoA hydrolase, mitochondrial n=1 Tax=Anthonomus grandis grandis TaxID=2921223 RepID=UPI002166777C|nr:3-hydroxyisobutyryl-CoA hydrolase, mitochondrial [Anthonomus grandis grandis]
MLTRRLLSGFINQKIIGKNMSTTIESDVILKDVGDKGVILLNRPKALNSLNLSMVNKIYPALTKWESEKKLVIMKGAGEKAFCAGGDVKAIAESAFKNEKSLGYEFFKKEYINNGLIGSYKIPYVALIDGIVMGGGVGLSVHGRYRVATEKTLFAMPETQIGLFPDVGGSYFLPRLQGRLGWYLALTGFRLKGSDVFKAGIATHYTDSSNLGDLEDALFKCSNDSEIKAVLDKFNRTDIPEFSLAPYIDQINKCFSAPTVEEIISRLERDGSKWALDTIQLLNKMSPTSLKVTNKELELGKQMNLFECLQMEYRLAVKCVDGHDFREGVRALLIDKDQNPKWNPATLKDVSEETVSKHFERLPEELELKHKL